MLMVCFCAKKGENICSGPSYTVSVVPTPSRYQKFMRITWLHFIALLRLCRIRCDSEFFRDTGARARETRGFMGTYRERGSWF